MIKKLSKQEVKVLQHLKTGLRMGEAGLLMGLSPKTVGTYIRRIKIKLNLPLHTNTYILVKAASEHLPEKKYKTLKVDKYILGGLKNGLSQNEISDFLKDQGIKPNSLSMIEKRLKVIRKIYGANNLYQLAYLMQVKGEENE